MASKAVSAQGTEFYISTGSATAVTITGITKATQAVVTNSGTNNLKVGDIITFGATVTGMPELNGAEAVVVAVASATSFTINVDSSTFATAATGGTFTASTYIRHCELTSYSGLDGSSSDIDVTTLCSTAKEYRVGLRDFGNFSLNHNVVVEDLAHIELRKAYADGLVRNFKAILQNGKGFAFQGLVKSYSVDGGVDATLTGTSDIRITGDVTFLTA